MGQSSLEQVQRLQNLELYSAGIGPLGHHVRAERDPYPSKPCISMSLSNSLLNDTIKMMTFHSKRADPLAPIIRTEDNRWSEPFAFPLCQIIPVKGY